MSVSVRLCRFAVPVPISISRAAVRAAIFAACAVPIPSARLTGSANRRTGTRTRALPSRLGELPPHSLEMAHRLTGTRLAVPRFKVYPTPKPKTKNQKPETEKRKRKCAALACARVRVRVEIRFRFRV